MRVRIAANLSIVVFALSVEVFAQAEQVASATSSAATAEAEPESAPSQPAPDASAQPPAKQDSGLKALMEEVRRLKLEIGIPDLEYKSYAGMGPAASKVYYMPHGLSIGGYGEATFTGELQQARKNVSDLLRFVLYTGYRFSDRIVLNAELEYEHASTEKQGAVNVEFAYLDFKLFDAIAVRAGNLLVPIGFINEMHEPPFFYGVRRPDLERFLIPTTWNENGVGLYGKLGGGVRYKAYLLNGLQAIGNRQCVTSGTNTVCDNGNEGMSADAWIREARSGGSRSIAESFAGVVNLAYDHRLFSLGGTLYYGRSGQGERVDDVPVLGQVTLGELHGSFFWRGLQARAIWAMGWLGNAGLISKRQDSTVGKRVQGGYAEVAYDVLTLLSPGSEMLLAPFVRYEGMDLNKEVAEGYVRNPAVNTRTLTAGLSYKPIPNVVLKADFQRRSNATSDGTAATSINLGTGFIF